MNVVTADIGASKVRVASYKVVEKGLTPISVERYPTARYEGLAPVLTEFLATQGMVPSDAVAIGVAGPVWDERVRMTNLPWIIDAAQMTRQLGCPVFLVNDLVAHGYGILDAAPGDLFTLKPGRERSGNKAVIAAGSGLGECIIFQTESGYRPMASEGGHCDFAPSNEKEIELQRFLLGRYPDHVSWERVVSGKHGFRNIFEFLTRNANEKSLSEGRDFGPWLVEEAESGSLVAQDALSLFFKLYGAEAGNLALKAMALGGVYLAGGIARKMLPWLQRSEFVSAFSSKGRMSDLLREIPIYVVMDVESPVKGLARYAFLKQLGKA